MAQERVRKELDALTAVQLRHVLEGVLAQIHCIPDDGRLREHLTRFLAKELPKGAVDLGPGMCEYPGMPVRDLLTKLKAIAISHRDLLYGSWRVKTDNDDLEFVESPVIQLLRQAYGDRSYVFGSAAFGDGITALVDDVDRLLKALGWPKVP